MNRSHRREDIFVSVCFADAPQGDVCPAGLAELSRRLTQHYRYCEVLFVVFADAVKSYQPLIDSVANVRLLVVRPGTPFYRCRSAVASEAIGDFVVLTSIEEQSAFDIIKMIELAILKGDIVVGRRKTPSFMNPALRALGRSAGFRVDTRIMLTACYPRALLSKLLTHPDRQLALRFLPSDRGITVAWLHASEDHSRSRSFRELGRRLGMVQKLLVCSAPRVLVLLSVLSLIVALSAISFAVYAVVIWSFLEEVQPGWFTTTLAQSFTAAFLGGAVFGLTIGLQRIIDALSESFIDDIVDERRSVDMYDQAMKELNVEIATTHGASHNDTLVSR